MYVGHLAHSTIKPFVLKNYAMGLDHLWRRAYHVTVIRGVEMVGAPDKLSKIRPYKCTTAPEATQLEKRLNMLKTETQQWHHSFWSKHNERFNQGKEEYIKNHKKYLSSMNIGDAKQTLNAEDMAMFHKMFLKQNHSLNTQYDREWRYRNRKILLLMLKVELQKQFHKLRKKFL
ncbi:cytochrome c oxidase assembly factor 8-like [Styela clava]|uniref:cytochrome c oxidase assembly factor 8-like n=1 Tax=Styela clava TaxID=7725 RepID=UPI001939F21D|nr:cytochrome c oxidase assembly factor 8-like [Styela clava]